MAPLCAIFVAIGVVLAVGGHLLARAIP